MASLKRQSDTWDWFWDITEIAFQANTCFLHVQDFCIWYLFWLLPWRIAQKMITVISSYSGVCVISPLYPPLCVLPKWVRTRLLPYLPWVTLTLPLRHSLELLSPVFDSELVLRFYFLTHLLFRSSDPKRWTLSEILRVLFLLTHSPKVLQFKDSIYKIPCCV